MECRADAQVALRPALPTPPPAKTLAWPECGLEGRRQWGGCRWHRNWKRSDCRDDGPLHALRLVGPVAHGEPDQHQPFRAPLSPVAVLACAAIPVGRPALRAAAVPAAARLALHAVGARAAHASEPRVPAAAAREHERGLLGRLLGRERRVPERRRARARAGARALRRRPVRPERRVRGRARVHGVSARWSRAGRVGAQRAVRPDAHSATQHERPIRSEQRRGRLRLRELHAESRSCSAAEHLTDAVAAGYVLPAGASSGARELHGRLHGAERAGGRVRRRGEPDGAVDPERDLRAEPEPEPEPGPEPEPEPEPVLCTEPEQCARALRAPDAALPEPKPESERERGRPRWQQCVCEHDGRLAAAPGGLRVVLLEQLRAASRDPSAEPEPVSVAVAAASSAAPTAAAVRPDAFPADGPLTRRRFSAYALMRSRV